MAAATPTRWKMARSFPRFALKVKLRVHTTGPDGAPLEIVGETLDLGLGGMKTRIDHSFAGRSRVTLEFIVPGATESLRILSKHKHTEQNEHGFQFLDISIEQREMIRRACENLPRV